MTQEARGNWTEELQDCLCEIRQGAEEMQAALIGRQTERILKAVEAQQAALGRLGRLGAGDLGPESAGRRAAGPEGVRLDDGVRGLLLKTRSALRRNRTLAARFLDVIGGTLRALDPGPSALGAYDAGGRPAMASGPRLVQRKV